MRNTVRNVAMGTLWLSASTVWAQQAPPSEPAKAPKATAQSEAGEPRANSIEPQADSQEPAAAATPPVSAHAKPVAAKSANPKSGNAADKLQLGTATVTGDREQPKVMYVVPWKKPDIGDPEGKPMNSLVDEILSPVDRDEFKREVSYYQTVKSQASQNGAQPTAAQPTEKVEK